MRNRYDIRQFLSDPIPYVEVRGVSFCREDLYELIGKNQFMSTFVFRPGTEASNGFGESVTGVIFYAKDEAEALEQMDNEGAELVHRNIRIDSPMPDLNQAQRENLKYGGVLVTDIEYISFMPYKRPEKYYESGEKIVPNVIEIPYEGNPKDDYNRLYQGYIASKINHGTELILFEKEEFIGITLGINNGHIDSRLLAHLGFDIEAVQASQNIWYHLYKAKERKQILSEQEKQNLSDLEFIRRVESIKKLLKEIKKSGVTSSELSKSSTALKTIKSSLKEFKPDILLHGKKQVYWNIDSYIHIVLRHVKQVQVGHFKDKTPFPYKFEDLEILIQQVLGSIEDEIKRHFEKMPDKDFVRHGKMNVLYNGDYYCLQISKDGRLMTLYTSGSKS